MDPSLLAAARHTLLATRASESEAGEATLGGELRSSLVCWEHTRGAPCECGGRRAHLFGARLFPGEDLSELGLGSCCDGAISRALGGARSCRFPAGRCRFDHPTRERIREDLAAWWSLARGSEPVWATARRGNDAARGGERATESSAPKADGEPCARETLPLEAQRERLFRRLHRHAPSSAYIRRFLQEPFLEATLLAHAPLRKLLAMKPVAKEVSEAYGAAAQARAILGRAGRDVGTEDGSGVTILDVCSGKGLSAVMVALSLPQSRVVMLDANGAMDLAHVPLVPNLSFVHFDLCATAPHT